MEIKTQNEASDTTEARDKYEFEISKQHKKHYTYNPLSFKYLFFLIIFFFSTFSAHSNIKLFITQCGLQSLQEAVYHGVPILGIPVFSDQNYNARKIATEEIGLQVPFQELTKEKLLTSITAILNDSK
jgi:UDP-N-acetylglucosamine:LPS N-acetylglucosamine transferase